MNTPDPMNTLDDDHDDDDDPRDDDQGKDQPLGPSLPMMIMIMIIVSGYHEDLVGGLDTVQFYLVFKGEKTCEQGDVS